MANPPNIKGSVDSWRVIRKILQEDDLDITGLADGVLLRYSLSAGKFLLVSPTSLGLGTLTSLSPGAPGSPTAASGLTFSTNPITSTGTLAIATAGVTNAMLVNPALTLSTSSGQLTGGGSVNLGGTLTFGLADTAVTPGSYTAASLTVDQKGRITAAASGSLDLSTVVITNPASSTRNLIQATGNFTPLTLKAFAGQTQPLFLACDSSGNACLTINSAGQFLPTVTVRDTASTPNSTAWQILDNTGGLRSAFGTYGDLTVNMANPQGASGWDTTVPFTVKAVAASSFTANLAELYLGASRKFYFSPSGSLALVDTLQIFNSSHFIGFKSPTLSADTTFTLPTGDGTAGQVIQTDGSRNLSWISADTSLRTDLANTATITLGDALLGFKQADASGFLTNAVARTVHQKLSERISVKDLGAVGDGVTDDTTAIQNALSRLTGSTAAESVAALYFPAGNYRITSTLSTPNSASNFTLYGDGYHSSTLTWDGAAGVPMLQLVNCRGGVIRDLGMIGNATNLPSSGVYVQRTTGLVGSPAPYEMLFQRVLFGGGSAPMLTTGVLFDGDVDQNNDNASFYDCSFFNCANYGISFEAANSLWHNIFGGFFNTCGVAAINNVGAGNAQGGSFHTYGTRFSGCGICYRIGRAQHSLHLFGSEAESCSQFLVTPTTIIQTNSASLHTHVLVSGGTIKLNDGTGIVFDADAHGVLDLHDLHIASPNGITVSFPTAGCKVNWSGGAAGVATVSYNCLLTVSSVLMQAGAPTWTNLGSGKLVGEDFRQGANTSINTLLGGFTGALTSPQIKLTDDGKAIFSSTLTMGTGTNGAQIHQFLPSAGTVGHQIKMASSQTADAFQLLTSGSVTLLKTTASGMVVGTGGLNVTNSYYALTGEGVSDLSITGMYDRNELANAALKGTVTVTITGAGTYTNTAANLNTLFDGTAGGFLDISAVDGTTSQIVLLVDMGSSQPNYSSARWMPFIQHRFTSGGPTYANTILVEVSADNTNWYTATDSSWQTSDAKAAEIVPTYWFGGNGTPSTISNWRYVRFTLSNLQIDSSYGSKDHLWIAEIGMRHKGARWTKNYALTAGDNFYGAMGFNTAQNQITLNPWGTSAGNTGEVRFLELAANGTQFVALKAPDSISASVTLTLPSTAGTNGQLLRTNGSGVLSFVDAATQAQNWNRDSTTGGQEFVYPATTTDKVVIGASTALSSATQIQIFPTVATRKGLVIQGASGQSAHLLELQNSSGQNYSFFDSDGSFLLSDSGNATRNTNALLDAQSTTKAFLFPRLTTTQRNALAGAAPGAGEDSLLLWNSSTRQFEYWDNTAASWKGISTSGGGGSVTSLSPGTPDGNTGGSGLTFSSNPITSSGSIALSNTAVTAGSYTRSSVTVDAQGRLTSAASGGLISLTADVTGILPIANGGTNANSAAGARTNLSAAALGVNSDITGLLGLNTQDAIQINPFGTAAGNTGEIRLLELAANGVNYVGFKSPDALAGNLIFSLPAVDGSSGQVLQTNGSKVLSFSTITNGMLANASITLTPGTGISISGSPVALGAAATVTLANTAVTAGTYGAPASLTVNAQGQLTAITAGTTNPTLVLSRTLPTTAGQEVDIGTFTLTQGAGDFWISVTVNSSGFSVAKQYLVPVQFETDSTWLHVRPVMDRGAYSGQDFFLDLHIVNNTVAFRLYRGTGMGTTAGTANILLRHEGVFGDVFAPSTASGAAAAAGAYYAPAGGFVNPILTAGAAYAGGTLVPGDFYAQDIVTPGALMGDTASFSYDQPLPDGVWMMQPQVSAAGQVTVTLVNFTGSSQVLPAGNFRVVIQRIV